MVKIFLHFLDPVSPTPHYNATILTDMLMKRQLHFLYGKLPQHQSLIDANVLCKIWLRRRRGFGNRRRSVASLMVGSIIFSTFSTRNFLRFTV